MPKFAHFSIPASAFLKQINSATASSVDLCGVLDPHGRNALHIAAEIENIAAVEALCRACPDLCAQQDKMGRVALHWACSCLSAPCISAVLQAAASAQAGLDACATARTTTSGETPLHWLAKAAASEQSFSDETISELISAAQPLLAAASSVRCRAGKLPSELLAGAAGCALRLRETMLAAEADMAPAPASTGAAVSSEVAAAIAPIQRSATGVSKARTKGPAKKKTLKVSLKPRA